MDQPDIRPRLYADYLAALQTVPFTGRTMPYHWGQLPKSMSSPWMLIYSQMFEEFSMEIANAVNQLTNYVQRLKAWDKVLAPLSDDEKMEALVEFIEPIATLALSLPYSIRNRFIFAIAHLCHQASQTLPGLQWKDDLPKDKDIGFLHAREYGKPWSTYPACEAAFKRIFKGDFEQRTLDFRHRNNHRFSARILIGLSRMVARRKDDASGNMRYVFGYTQPLDLKLIADATEDQCVCCYAAFDAFQALVREHEAAILNAAKPSAK